MLHNLKKISFMPKAAQVHRMLLFLNLGGRWVPQSNSFPRMVPDQGHQKHPGRQILKMQTLWPVLGLSRSVMSNSLQPQELQPIRLLCPWYSPRNSTGVGCHSLLQGIFPTQELNLCLLHCRWILYCLSHHRSPLWPQSWPAGSRTVQSGRDQWVCYNKPCRWCSPGLNGVNTAFLGLGSPKSTLFAWDLEAASNLHSQGICSPVS